MERSHRVCPTPDSGGSHHEHRRPPQPDNVTRENYDEVASRLESAGVWPNPDGLEFHVLFGSEGNLRVSEIWDSREQFGAFGEHLQPILADVGIGFSAEPEVFDVHNIAKR